MLRRVALRRILDVVRAHKPRIGAPKHAKYARSSDSLSRCARVVVECRAQRAAVARGWRLIRGWGWGSVRSDGRHARVRRHHGDVGHRVRRVRTAQPRSREGVDASPRCTRPSPRTLAHWVKGKPRGQAGQRTFRHRLPACAHRRRNPLTRPRALRGSLRAAGAPHRPHATTRRRNWRRLCNRLRRPGAGRRTGPAGAPDLRGAWAGLREGGGELPVKLGEQRSALWAMRRLESANERAYGGGSA